MKKTAQEDDTDVRIINVSSIFSALAVAVTILLTSLTPQVGSNAYKWVPKDVHYKTKEDFTINTGKGFIGGMKRYCEPHYLFSVPLADF